MGADFHVRKEHCLPVGSVAACATASPAIGEGFMSVRIPIGDSPVNLSGDGRPLNEPRVGPPRNERLG